jgi:ABC-type enterobactin transport system permease subunit
MTSKKRRRASVRQRWRSGSSSYRIGSPVPSLVAFVISGVLIAIVGALIQPTANGYLGDKYPEASPLGMTWGETTAAVIGLLLFGGVIADTFV